MTRLQRQRRRRRTHGSPRNKVLLGVAVLGSAALVGMLALVGYVVSIAASAPDISSLKAIDQGGSSAIFASDGQRLGFIQADQLRTPLPAARIPQVLKQATVAIEDQRFYKHKGVDYEGIIRAAIKNLRSGKNLQGGSTITMQLVRNLYIENPKRNFSRKIREAKLAEELEDQHTKQWILDKYLNSVSYGTFGGQTAVGIQAAARTIFDKPVTRLTLDEAALLAGLPQAPSDYNPFQEPQRALDRRNNVLRKMADLGMVTRAEALIAERKPLGVKKGTYYTARREQYFLDYVQQKLIERYGINTVRKGGLKVYTTVELKFQRAARRAMAGQLNQAGDPASAVVTIDPSNGYIKAMASSSNYRSSKFNLAAQGHRQAGSTFKVMVLMTALRRGVSPSSTFYTSRHLTAGWLPGYPTYEVQTYGHSYGGSMSLVSATLKSDNTVYAQLDADLGPEAVKQTAKDMGITTKLDGFPAEGLGGLRLGVSPLEMANAYATIASGGYRNKPIAIKEVVFPDGKSEDLGKPKRTRAFSDGVTAEATKILRQNVTGGTGTRANIGCPAAGKTGTTDSFNDAWFVGFTPKLTTAVWVGYPNAQVEMRSVHGISVAGGTFPAGIWHDYMMVAKGSDCSDFAPPKTPFVSTSFFGKFESIAPTVSTDADGKDGSKDADGTGGAEAGKPGNGYDPKLYESPPQGTPQTGAPEAPGQ